MLFLLRRLATLAILFILASAAKADLALSVVAESADPTQLSVGQTVRFDVVLSGLLPGESMDYLAGTVTFEGSLLGTAFNVTPGETVPDLSGFVGVGFDGAADAFYDAVFFSISNTPIMANGVFYTFDVVAQEAGSGSLQLDPTSLAAADGTNSPVPLAAGPALSYTITGTAVPEPGSLILMVTGLMSCAGFVWMSSVRFARAS